MSTIYTHRQTQTDMQIQTDRHRHADRHRETDSDRQWTHILSIASDRQVDIVAML